MKTLTDKEWAWISGLLEGEACFGITNNYPVLNIQMTDYDVMQKLSSYLDVPVKGPRQRGNNKPCYDIAFRKKEKLQWICENIYEYMGTRRKEALDRWIEHWNSKSLSNVTAV